MVVQWPHGHLSCLLEQKNGMDIVRCNGSVTLSKHGIVIHVSHQLRCYSTQLAAICSDNGMKIEMLIIRLFLSAIHWRLMLGVRLLKLQHMHIE